MFASDNKQKTIVSRSTWACELKLWCCLWHTRYPCHAPRERVSWNLEIIRRRFCKRVTLHVSVWVEICNFLLCEVFRQSRSTWACELKYGNIHQNMFSFLSRSTWACELKSPRLPVITTTCPSHAPRERVSWNASVLCPRRYLASHAPRERVSWNVK